MAALDTLLRSWMVTAPLACLVVATVGALLRWWLAGWSVRRNARLAREGWSPHDGTLDRLEEGSVAVLAGTLQVARGPVARPEDGKPAGVIAVATSRSRFSFVRKAVDLRVRARADELILKRQGDAVEIEGSVDLLVGSRHFFAGRLLRSIPPSWWQRLPPWAADQGAPAIRSSSWGLFRSASHDDEVLVRGVARRVSDQPGPGQGYRQAAFRWKLTPVGPGEHVGMQGRRPRFRVTLWRWLLTPGMAAVATLSLLTFGVVARTGSYLLDSERCSQSAACRADGHCGTSAGLVPSGCIAVSDADCQRTEGCRSKGHCSAYRDRCRAVKDADCSGSVACAERGLCGADHTVLHTGNCEASTDDHCLPSLECRREGRCTAAHRKCIVTHDAACIDSEACKKDGRCKASRGRCVAGSKPVERPQTSESCGESAGCREHGRCVPLGTECILHDTTGCWQSADCQQRGKCTAVEDDDGHPRRCIATRSSDCARAQICRVHRACTAVDGECVARPGQP